MRTILLTVLLLAASASAFATSTYRFRGGVVSVGDSIAGLAQRAGAPSRVVPLENEYGAAIGERWDYYIDGKLVSFEITGGVVVHISETR